RILGPVAIAGTDTNEEAMLFSSQSAAPFAMELFEDLVHPFLFGCLADHSLLAAKLGTPAAPSLERAFPVWPYLGCSALEAGLSLRKVVSKAAVLQVAAVLEHPRLGSDQPLDEYTQGDQSQPVRLKRRHANQADKTQQHRTGMGCPR